MGERVVRRRVLRLLDEQPGRDGGRHQVAECHEVVSALALRDPNAHLSQILQAEMATEKGCLGERRLRIDRKMCRPTLDQRAHCRRRQPFGIASQGPRVPDLLQHPGFAIGPADLLHDEGNALGLTVDRRGRRGLDLPAEHLAEELRRLHHREARDLQPPDHAHPLHVGEQRDRFGDGGELLGADREHQEDRAPALGPDHVPEQAEAVFVGPLHVVDQQGERSVGGERSHRHRRQVERAEQPLVRRQPGEGRIVATAEGFGGRGDRRLRSGAGDGLGHLGSTHDRSRQEEGSSQLLVGTHRHGEEPAGDRDLPSGQEQASLADPRLTLDRDGGQSSARGTGDPFLDRRELSGSSHHGSAGPMLEETERRERSCSDGWR